MRHVQVEGTQFWIVVALLIVAVAVSSAIGSGATKVAQSCATSSVAPQAR